MKKLVIVLAAILMVFAVLSAPPARAEIIPENETADWTVLFYLCGADLESRYGYGTETLDAINDCLVYQDWYTGYRNIDHLIRGEPQEPFYQESGRVRVVMETGGSKSWNAQKLGIDIASDRLQRWEYHIDVHADGTYPTTEMQLKEELPLDSMANPETLRDFITWSVQNYPAQKYMLVLWGHGGGGKSGVLTDELFGGDRMNLGELKRALGESGVVFETVLFDACMMASLETACAIQETARWMVASEEVVAGKGSAVGNWLQQLYNHPDCDGRMLGRWICDMTQIRYGNEEDKRNQDLLTWSVIDLSKIQRLADDFDRFAERIGRLYAEDSVSSSTWKHLFGDSEKYGEAVDGMQDLAGLYYDVRIMTVLDTQLYRDTLDALSDAVVYSVRGNGRSAAMGISICDATQFDNEELDTYALNCPSPHYLAFWDALSPTWTAPDWVYEKAEKLPEVSDLESYRIEVEKDVSVDGIPGIVLDLLTEVDANYRLYRKNEETGQIVLLGENRTLIAKLEKKGYFLFYANEPWMWPAVENTICCIDMVENSYYGNIYSIPLQIGTDIWNLRCSYDDEEDEFEIYGLWEGYDADSSVLGRNVTSLAMFAGRDFRLVYPVDDEGTDETQYEGSERMTLYRAIRMGIQPLPEGVYYIEYIVLDHFSRPITLERIEMIWDGQKAVFSGIEDWEGSETLKWTGWPDDRE